MKIDVMKQIQALYDSAGLGSLNFKFFSPYNWHLMKSRATSFGDTKNTPSTKKRGSDESGEAQAKTP